MIKPSATARPQAASTNEPDCWITTGAAMNTPMLGERAVRVITMPPSPDISRRSLGAADLFANEPTPPPTPLKAVVGLASECQPHRPPQEPAPVTRAWR